MENSSDDLGMFEVKRKFRFDSEAIKTSFADYMLRDDKEWWSMLGEAKATSGIGVRTAHSIQCTSTKRPL
jgi:hypothetical protein